MNQSKEIAMLYEKNLKKSIEKAKLDAPVHQVYQVLSVTMRSTSSFATRTPFRLPNGLHESQPPMTEVTSL